MGDQSCRGRLGNVATGWRLDLREQTNRLHVHVHVGYNVSDIHVHAVTEMTTVSTYPAVMVKQAKLAHTRCSSRVLPHCVGQQTRVRVYRVAGVRVYYMYM